MQSLFGLKDKNILVVGGGQGMGEATVRLLAKVGANVAVMDLEADRAERVAHDAAEAGAKAYPISVDVLDDDGLIAAIAQVERGFGPLDGMVTIIGMAAWSSIIDMTTETWDLDHRRNLRYFFVAGREVARSMVQRGSEGSIVAISSIDGIVSSPFHASYGAAKAGMVNLVKSFALELGDKGIRVNAIAPGAIVTPRIPPADPETDRQRLAMLPMRRRGTTADIAKAAVFFLSDLSPYITGQTLPVDGGYTATGIFGHGNKIAPS